MKKLFLCFALVGMASTLCAQERGDMLVSVSNRDFSLGLNVGATIAFNYYF